MGEIEREREKGEEEMVQFQVATVYYKGTLIYCHFVFFLKLLIISAFSY